MDAREVNRQNHSKEVNDQDEVEEQVAGPAKNEQKMAEETKVQKSSDFYEY